MSTWQFVERNYAAIVGLDANAEWLLDQDAGKSLFLRKGLGLDSGKEPPFAFLLTPVEGGATGEAMLTALDDIATQEGEGEGEGEGVRFNMSEADRDRLRNGQSAGALCSADFIDEILSTGEPNFAGMKKAMQLSSAVPIEAAPKDKGLTFVPPRELERTLSGLFGHDNVVIGVIDDGFAIAHPRLRLASDNTRVASFWDQEAPFNKDFSTVPFGRELLKPDIAGLKGLDTILKDHDGAEAEIYSNKDLSVFYPKKRNAMPRNTSHGTVVLDLAAGEAEGAGKRRPVVAVKLPRSSVLDTSGAHLDFFLLQGIHHILSRAEMITNTPDPRVIIVASYGYFGGPLDGASQFERTLDQILNDRNRRVQVVLPSGNGRLERAHAVRPDCGPVGHVHSVKWRSPAGDRTPSVMEIWTDPIGGDPAHPTLKLTVTTPDGQGSAAHVFTDSNVDHRLVLKKNPSDRPEEKKIVAQAVCDHPPMHPGRRRFMVWLSPTALPPPDVRSPPGLSGPGVWTVSIETLSAAATDLSVWIRRDDSLPGFPSLGRQSSVERDPPQEGPMPLTQEQWDRWYSYGTASVTSTMSAIASGQLPVVTCGYGARDKRAARSAAGGPVALTASVPPTERREGPDCLAPSQVTELRGIKAANFFGGAKVSMSGTSLAAPLIGYWLSQLYLSGIGTYDGRLRTTQEAKQSDLAMPPEWKPEIVRGGDRFLENAMVQRTFRYDDI